MAELQTKKYVIVSTNNNSDYMFYAPYIEKAWNTYGWTLVVMVTHDVNKEDLKLNNPESLVFHLPEVDRVRMESMAQAGRLYAANYLDENALIMTSDMDLLPLKDYWHPNPDTITVYGHDLTDYTYYPMGYTAMKGYEWVKYMRLSGHTKSDMELDAEEYQNIVFAKDWEAWWNWDWRMLTDRLKPYADHITFVTRGRQSNGFAYGRIDRGNSMAHVEGELIDAHCENNNVRHEAKMPRFLEIFEKVYGKL